MEITWRWFGPSDKITLPMLRQIGVEGIVTALHNIPNGEVWPVEKIREMQAFIESYGMKWSVVESLPVSEAIKYAGPERDQLIENYKVSLANLAECGIRTVCYNFMPVLDWARTDLTHPWPDGTSSLYFSQVQFAYFDIYILGREGARESFTAEVVAKADELAKSITVEECRTLVENIIIKTQNFVSGNISGKEKDPVETFKGLLKLYEGIDRKKLKENMKYFLNAIMPVCDKYDIDMCVHPDDPPFQILGLPRIVTSAEDIRDFLNAVPNPHNGLTFCAGSLSAGAHNDITAMAREFAPNTKFAHLRSCQIFENGDFMEASHLAGRADLVELVRIFEKQNPAMPMRVDHGRIMLGDEDKGYNPGYEFHGRMFALGQVQGIIAVVRNEMASGKI